MKRGIQVGQCVVAAGASGQEFNNVVNDALGELDGGDDIGDGGAADAIDEGFKLRDRCRNLLTESLKLNERMDT